MMDRYERRAARQETERRRMRKSGKTLGKVYQDVLRKVAKKS